LEYINGNQTFILDSHRPFICSVREKAWVSILEYQAMHAFFAWYSSWRMVVYIYYISSAPSARNLAAPVRANGTVRKRQAVWPVHHVQNHFCRVTLFQPAGWAAVLGHHSSLRPHCLL
jgi:hypothetical protein